MTENAALETRVRVHWSEPENGKSHTTTVVARVPLVRPEDAPVVRQEQRYGLRETKPVREYAAHLWRPLMDMDGSQTRGDDWWLREQLRNSRYELLYTAVDAERWVRERCSRFVIIDGLVWDMGEAI